MHYCKAIWILSLIGSNINFAAGTCCSIMHTMIMGSHPKFSRCDKSHEVQPAELRVKCCVSDKVPSYTRGYVAATCPCNTCANSAIWSQLHVPATQPCNVSPHSVLNAILSPLHFAATCSSNMSPRVGPP